MFKKILLAVVIFLTILINVKAQNTQREERLACNMRLQAPKCDQPKQPKGAYYQRIEQYSTTVYNDSLQQISVVSELSVILNFKKRKKVTMFVRRFSADGTYPTTFKYLYEKKGSWKMQRDTLTIIWKYQKDTLSAKWLRITGNESLILKYERYFIISYSADNCRSALISNNKSAYIGYGYYQVTGLRLVYRKFRLKMHNLFH